MRRLLAMLGLCLAALPLAAETLSGTLQWVGPLEISTPRSGMVTEVLVSSGQSLRGRVAGLELEGVVVDPGLLPDPDSDSPRYLAEVHFTPPEGSDRRAGQTAEIVLP